MQVVQITDLCGAPPYTAKVCDYTYTFCFAPTSGITEVPFNLDVPEELQGTYRVIVETTEIGRAHV